MTIKAGWTTILKSILHCTRGRERNDYIQRTQALHRKLGIPPDYGLRGMLFHREARTLVPAPAGIDGITHLVTPITLSKWLEMRATAASNGVTLLLYCGFRSLEEQAALIRNQIAAGDSIEQILTWIAAPGYSEHHTGCALDIGCIGCFPPTAKFADTKAFSWLNSNAELFGFKLSYPRNNPHGVIFEPWHWFCRVGYDDAPAPT